MRQSVQAARAAFFVSAATFLLAVSCVPNLIAADASTLRDYVLPGETSGGHIQRRSASVQTGQSTGKNQPESKVLYQAFDGNKHELVQHRGQFVALLVPDLPAASVAFTSDHIEELLDQLDLLYLLYAEILGAEPAGTGLLNVAFIPETCGSGCALLGKRGFEIRFETSILQVIIDELDSGGLHPVLMHEMAHNFDTLSSYLHYLPDHAHAWTDLFEYFAPRRYGRMAGRSEAPDELFDTTVRNQWMAYLDTPGASWASCVDNAECPGLSRNHLWAMLYYRVETLFGPAALIESFKFLREYSRTNYPPSSDIDKESLRVLSLAVGAETNLACYLDEINWPLSASVRAEMNQRYGASGLLCADQDNDGSSVFGGDCNDQNPFTNRQSPELPGTGLDEDCDELVDEINFAEGGANDDFQETVRARVPSEVVGSSANLQDLDTFSFPLPQSGRVRVKLCADEGFSGWAIALKPDGSSLQSGNWFSYQTGKGCSTNTFDYSSWEEGSVSVVPDKSAGPYQLTLGPGKSLQPEFSDLISVVPHSSGGVTVQFRDQQDQLAGLGADEIEVWVSGAGLSLRRPFSTEIDITLNAQSAPALRNGKEYRVRFRARSDGAPLTEFSAGHLFRYTRAAEMALPVTDRMSGTWFDPEHNGEGFVLEVLDQEQAVVYWFTYDANGNQRWMLGVGQVEEGRVRFNSLLHTEGARFGAAFKAEDVKFREEGSLTISFLDCHTALVNYVVDGTGGDQSLTRLTHALGHQCGQGSSTPAPDLTGSWFDPERNGEGFVVQQLTLDRALVYWFTYDDEGGQAWMFNTGSIVGNQIHFPDLLNTAGGHFGRSYDAGDIDIKSWGSLVLELDCSGGMARWTRSGDQVSAGEQSLVRLSRLQNSGCP